MIRKIILFVIVYLLIFELGYSQSKTENKTNNEANTTLVNNQLTPELIKVENASGFANGDLKTADGKSINKFQQSSFTISAFPAALINNKNTQLYMGVGYTNQKFSDFTTTTYAPLFSESIKSFFVGTAFSEKIGKQYFWLNYLQTGFNGISPFQNIDKTFNIEYVSKIDYKLQRNLNLGLGIAYFTNMGAPLVLPAITFTYSQTNFIINLDFPIKTEIEGIFDNGKIRPVMGISYHGGNYYLNNYNQYLYNFGAFGYAGVRFRILDFLYLYTAYQTGVYDQYKAGPINNLSKIGTYSGQNQLVVSLNIQMEKFIPLLAH
jgi:hypothetical protein